MRMTEADHSNVWRVNSHRVDGISLYADEGVVLVIDGYCIWGPGSQAIQSLDDVSEIIERRKVNLTRREHFNVRGQLYLYLPALGSHTQVEEYVASADEIRRYYKERTVVWMRINGEPARHVELASGHFIRSELTAFGERAEKVAAIYNETVTDHHRSNIGACTAARLIKALPSIIAVLEEGRNHG